jgi:hypothetical protein
VGKLTKSAASTTATTAASAESSVVVLLRRRFLFNFLLLGFVDGCHDDRRCLLRACDLNERMLMGDAVLADLAEVEIRAHRALVSNTKDRAGSTTVTGNFDMLPELKFLVNNCGTLRIKILAFH